MSRSATFTRELTVPISSDMSYSDQLSSLSIKVSVRASSGRSADKRRFRRKRESGGCLATNRRSEFGRLLINAMYRSVSDMGLADHAFQHRPEPRLEVLHQEGRNRLIRQIKQDVIFVELGPDAALKFV